GGQRLAEQTARSLDAPPDPAEGDDTPWGAFLPADRPEDDPVQMAERAELRRNLAAFWAELTPTQQELPRGVWAGWSVPQISVRTRIPRRTLADQWPRLKRLGTA